MNPTTNEPCRYLHLTIGPVQSFVSQARRVRDFWAGSFLLSWLSGVAMASVQTQQGTIEFPIPDDQFLDALKGVRTDGPQQGSIPNRFKSVQARVPADFNPQQVEQHIREAWSGLAQHIWARDLDPLLKKMSPEQLETTRTIWDRQIQDFWEINWCLTDNPDNTSLLDRRKNWRNHGLPNEGGVKCMMMGSWQELSGQDTPNRAALDAFWKPIQRSIAHGNDLRDREQLCALAWVKRRFAHHFNEFNLQLSHSALTLHGWPLTRGVPSLTYLASASWQASLYQTLHEQGNDQVALSFLQAAKAANIGLSEKNSQLPFVKAAAENITGGAELAALDGNLFHDFLYQEKDYSGYRIKRADPALSALRHMRSVAQCKEAPPFYAVLLMDGDQLGSQMSDKQKQKSISTALLDFTRGVEKIVQSNNGFLVYAGGDDVLALLPIQEAIHCASSLRDHYDACFAQQNAAIKNNKEKIHTSLSGAIEFAHIKIPLTRILTDAHDLLDNIAKDATGRNALAIRVWKPGGQHLQWSVPWENGNKSSHITTLEHLVTYFTDQEANSPFSQKFMFKAMALGKKMEWQHFSSTGNESSLLHSLLKAELIHSGIDLKKTDQNMDKLDEFIRQLISLSDQHSRHGDHISAPISYKTSGTFSPDCLLLIRFLAQYRTLLTNNLKHEVA